MAANDTELLPCPFCGGKAGIFCGNSHRDHSVEYRAACFDDDCMIDCFTPSYATEGEAIAAWNRRTPAPAAMGREAGCTCAPAVHDKRCALMNPSLAPRAEAVEASAPAVEALPEDARVPDDFAGWQAPAYRAGWNDAVAAHAAPPRPSEGVKAARIDKAEPGAIVVGNAVIWTHGCGPEWRGTVRHVVEFSDTETRYNIELDDDQGWVVGYPSNTRLAPADEAGQEKANG